MIVTNLEGELKGHNYAAAQTLFKEPMKWLNDNDLESFSDTIYQQKKHLF